MPFFGRAAALLAIGLAIACSKAEPRERAVLGEEELGAAGIGSGGASGCASDADCPGKCWQCDLGVSPHACEPVVQGTVCAPSGGNVCDAADICDNAGNCVVTFAPATKVCANANGACDADDHCSGTSLGCVPAFALANTPCGDPTNIPCNGADTCNGTGQCQTHIASQGTTCGDQTNNPPCNLPNTCNATGQCQENFGNQGAACGDQTNDTCNGRNTCNGAGACLDNFTSAGTPCGSATETECNHADRCDGSGNCALNLEPVGTACLDQTTDQCKRPDTCDANGVCQSNDPPVTTPCDDGLVCTVGDHCSGTGGCEKGIPTKALCGPPDCSDRSVPGCCADWYCDVDDTNTTSRGCLFQPAAANSLVCRPVRAGCDAPELCDGTKDCPADVQRPAGYQCQAPLCSSSVAHPKVTCDGTAFDCAPQPTCDPFACNAATTACRTTCTSSAQCLDAYYCDTRTGRCEPRTPGGDPCQDASTCATQFCVDGVCCDARCTGQCEACDIRGREGVCSPIPEGDDPADHDNDACDTDGTLCGGACDGVTTDACTYPPRATQCAEPACDLATNEAVPASFCDGSGSCAFEVPASCSPYACGADACNGDCTVDPDCDSASYCRSGVCTPRVDTGETCSRAAQCRSGFCVDGVCCESACQGQCEACNGRSGAGVCGAASGDPVGDRPACAGSGTCGGECDGSRRDVCAYPGRAVSCREGACSDGLATLGAACDGRGECPPAEFVECPKGCEGLVCAGDVCVIDADCPSGSRCAAGTCVPRGSPGTSCGRSSDCASGHCTDGVCCESACLGQCEACDVSGSEGSCVPIDEGDGPHGARTACVSDGSACAGACNGIDTAGCSYPDGNACRAASCSTSNGRSVATLDARCSGTGRCPAEERQSCPAACSADRRLCEGGCSADPDACPRDSYCSAGVCTPERPTGGSCSNVTQCSSGFCVDGFCCASLCDGRCEACDGAGSVGTCAAVEGAPHGGRPACEGTGTCAASCDGSARDACAFPDDGTSCGPESCSNGAHSDGASCDGAGECVDAKATACPATACDGNRCGTGCETDADCTGDNICDGGRCKSNPVLDAIDRGSCGCRVPGGRGGSAEGLLALLVGMLAIGLERRSRSRQRRGRA